jgi:hypothetical protein
MYVLQLRRAVEESVAADDGDNQHEGVVPGGVLHFTSWHDAEKGICSATLNAAVLQ